MRNPRLEVIRKLVLEGEYRGPNFNGELSLCCPFCPDREGKDDTKYRLQLNPKKSVFFCYRCRVTGYGDMNWFGEDIIEKPLPPKPTIEAPKEFKELSDVSSWVYTKYVNYLKRRGVWEQAKAVGAGACISGFYAGRVIIPMMDARKVWTGFSARQVTGDTSRPKYLYPLGMDRRGSVWGTSWVPKIQDVSHPLFLVEGVFDALPLFPYGLAAFGKNITDTQLDILKGLDRKVIVCLDGDAWLDGKVLAQRLSFRGVESSYCHLPPGTDPGTLGTKVQEYIKEL